MTTQFRSLCQLAEFAELADSAAFLTQIRQQLHQHPELSFQEAATAELVAGKLQEWGYQVTRNVGGHGVVGSLTVGAGTGKVSVRADMDALPIQEASGLAHQSKNAGVMHACGHDGHTTMLLGAAQQIAKRKQFSGTVHLVFQPAEEAGSPSGALRMIQDGLFERFPCDAIFGLHNHPGLAAGNFGFGVGSFMSASDTFYITIHGRGGHAARPHQTIDPILIAGSLVMALQSIVARNIDPLQTAIVTVGSLHAGNASNVIPESAKMALSVRSFDEKVRQQLRQRICDLVNAQVQSYGGQVEIELEEGYPSVVNSEPETHFARQVAEQLVGKQHVHAPFGPITGSEDFAFYLQRKPGCFLRLGNGEKSAMLHNAKYDFNDENLPIGAAYWTLLVERYLAVQSSAA